MRDSYPRGSQKSKGEFEVLGGRELALRLPLVEVWEELPAEVERLTGEVGLQILRAILEDEVRQRVGPPYRPDPASGSVRWGGRSGAGKLPPLAAGRADAARRGRAHRLRAFHPEVSAGGRVGVGRLGHPQEQCEPALRRSHRRAARSGTQVPPRERLSGTEGVEGAESNPKSRVALPGPGGLKCNSTRAATFN